MTAKRAKKPKAATRTYRDTGHAPGPLLSWANIVGSETALRRWRTAGGHKRQALPREVERLRRAEQEAQVPMRETIELEDVGL